MAKLKIHDKEVRTDILDDAQKAFIVDYVNRKPPSTFPLGINLKFDNSGGLTISFDDNGDNKAWYVGAKMNSAVPKQAQACDSIEEALYKCIKAWGDSHKPVQMPQVLEERKLINDMKQRAHKGLLNKFASTLPRKQKFFKPDSLRDIIVSNKNTTNKPRNS
jgi:hypothetical protein